MPSPRVVRTFCSAARRSASPSSGATRADRLEHRLAETLVDVDAEELLGHRVGVEQPAGSVDRDDAAADVVEDVLGLEARLLERRERAGPSLRRSRAARPTDSDAERDEREDAELQPDARLDERRRRAEENERRRRNRARARARR